MRASRRVALTLSFVSTFMLFLPLDRGVRSPRECVAGVVSRESLPSRMAFMSFSSSGRWGRPTCGPTDPLDHALTLYTYDVCIQCKHRVCQEASWLWRGLTL